MDACHAKSTTWGLYKSGFNAAELDKEMAEYLKTFSTKSKYSSYNVTRFLTEANLLKKEQDAKSRGEGSAGTKDRKVRRENEKTALQRFEMDRHVPKHKKKKVVYVTDSEDGEGDGGEDEESGESVIVVKRKKSQDKGKKKKARMTSENLDD